MVLKLPALIGLNETVTFKGKQTKNGGMGDLERIHIKEVLQQTQLRRMRNSLFFAAHAQTDGNRDEGWQEVRYKCVRKISHDQNSSHKAWRLRAHLLLEAAEAPPGCEPPSMLHHENTGKPQREVLEQREGSRPSPRRSPSVSTLHMLHCRFGFKHLGQ